MDKPTLIVEAILELVALVVVVGLWIGRPFRVVPRVLLSAVLLAPFICLFLYNLPSSMDRFNRRAQHVQAIQNSGDPNATDQFVDAAWAFIRDYPQSAQGYNDIMAGIEDYEGKGQTAKARLLAQKLIDFPTPAIQGYQPDQFKVWARGFLNRLDSFHKPMTIQFAAVDGREVNLASMRGRVVLVDFWATTCAPCVGELPRVYDVYNKFHNRGFEVIGISCDDHKDALLKFLKKTGYPWPQYFDGNPQGNNKFTAEFGIDGVPHIFLVDKKGLLRFDDVQVYDPTVTNSLDDKISTLLAEQ